MKKTVIMLKVLFTAMAVTAAAMKTIEDTEIAEVLGEKVISDHWNSTIERNIPGGKSRAVLNFRAPCDFGNGGQTYWPHPTNCNKYVVCAPGGPMEKNCHEDLVWSQSKTTCDWHNTELGQSPIKEDASCQCGLVNVPTKRIIGGTEVSPTRKYPWHVGLHKDGVKHYSCGGSIVSDRWIITAAHCIVKKKDCSIYDSSDKLNVWVGDHDQFTTCDNVPDTKPYTVKTYLKHEDYKCPSTDVFQDKNVHRIYDIGLLELNKPIEFNNLIRPICLPTFTDNIEKIDKHFGVTGTVTGWGSISESKFIPSSFLREVQVVIRNNDDCNDNVSPLTLLKICAGPSPNAVGNMGNCDSDSGGPLSVIDNKLNNKHVLVGVVSGDSGRGGGCGHTDNAGTYTRVAHPEILKWINGKLKKSSDTMCP